MAKQTMPIGGWQQIAHMAFIFTPLTVGQLIGYQHIKADYFIWTLTNY